MASLARLKRSSVDLLQLHNRIGSKPGGRVMTVEQTLGRNGVADGLNRLREKGLIRHMGITALGEAASVCEVIRSGRFDFCLLTLGSHHHHSSPIFITSIHHLLADESESGRLFPA
jgi:predicted aldo/keto reductase-like oxidoreductase